MKFKIFFLLLLLLLVNLCLNALPLSKQQKVVLFGASSYDLLVGGSGSGNVNRAYKVYPNSISRSKALNVHPKPLNVHPKLLDVRSKLLNGKMYVV